MIHSGLSQNKIMAQLANVDAGPMPGIVQLHLSGQKQQSRARLSFSRSSNSFDIAEPTLVDREILSVAKNN